MKYYTWLNCTPNNAREPRSKSVAKIREFNLKAEYLFRYYQEIIDIVEKLTLTELKSWCFFSGVELNRWESKTIMEVNAVHSNWLIRAKDNNCTDPLATEEESQRELQDDFNKRLSQCLLRASISK